MEKKMKKSKISKTCVLIFAFFTLFSFLKADTPDPKTIFKLSKAISEWKLMNEDKYEKIRHTALLPKLFDQNGEKGIDEPVLFKGFFSNAGEKLYFESLMKNWEWNSSFHPFFGMSNQFSHYLYTYTDPFPGILTSFAYNATMDGIKASYYSMGNIFNNISNVYRAELGLGLSDDCLINTLRGGRILTTTSTVMNTMITAASVFKDTIIYVGKSMQIMNPPVYLREFTSGSKFLNIIPVSGKWEGAGFRPIPGIPGGILEFNETLVISDTGLITRTHIDMLKSDFGTITRTITQETPATNTFERIAMTNFPVGSYIGPTATTRTTITTRHLSVRTIQGGFDIKHIPITGNSPITPLDTSVFNTGDSIVFKNNLSFPKATWAIPKYTWSIPKYTWVIPKYTWSLPTFNLNTNYTGWNWWKW
jgi:hypothetical protein